LKKLNGRGNLEDLDIDRTIKIITMSKKEDGRAWT
jgi:hypothetical protein